MCFLFFRFEKSDNLKIVQTVYRPHSYNALRLTVGIGSSDSSVICEEFVITGEAFDFSFVKNFSALGVPEKRLEILYRPWFYQKVY